ncbi:MAG: type IV pilus modification protein PilV [Burkholderiaceae bacterium]|nr:type IV pilus modification protein PilV [Burkholderiaceae bacterium]
MFHYLKPKRDRKLSTRQQQTGFSLLEVLIAFIILSLGMLGAVGMQAAAMQSNKETRSQSVAASFARELADKMRGNHTVAIKTAAADNPYLKPETTLTGLATFISPQENCFTTACSTREAVATWDMADWQNRLQNALPDPKFKVCFDKTPFDADGKAHWACTDDGDISVLKMAWTNTGTDGVLKFTSDMRPLIIVPLTAGTPN